MRFFIAFKSFFTGSGKMFGYIIVQKQRFREKKSYNHKQMVSKVNNG